jgi:hypothetical protein
MARSRNRKPVSLLFFLLFLGFSLTARGSDGEVLSVASPFPPPPSPKVAQAPEPLPAPEASPAPEAANSSSSTPEGAILMKLVAAVSNWNQIINNKGFKGWDYPSSLPCASNVTSNWTGIKCYDGYVQQM